MISLNHVWLNKDSLWSSTQGILYTEVDFLNYREFASYVILRTRGTGVILAIRENHKDIKSIINTLTLYVNIFKLLLIQDYQQPHL